MSDLVERQQQFSRMLGDLIQHIYASGYQCTLGEILRTPEQAALNAKLGIGIKNSLHCQKLAIDMYFFSNGELIATPLNIGEWWEAHGGSWGGRFSDPAHFSLSYGGRK